MSDGITDMYRDERRAQDYNAFLDKLLKYLETPSETSYEELTEVAESVDSVPRGLAGGRTTLIVRLEEQVQNLKKGDKKEWAFLLSNFDYYSPRYQRFKAISPFDKNLLLFVNYGHGFANIHSPELHEAITSADFLTFDGDKYLVEVSPPKKKRFTWIGAFGKKTSRDQRGNPKSQ